METNLEDNVKYVIDYQPKLMKVIEDEETAKLVMDELYFPILKVLRKGPMTVKKIEKEYNKTVSSDKTKSDKTIYRYLKTLQEADLVEPAGQKVVIGKTATETLFSRTAYAFYLRNEQTEFWLTDNGNKMAKALGEALSPLVPNKEINLDKFVDFLHNLSAERIDRLKEILEKADNKLLEGISGYDWQKFTLFYNLGGFFAIFLSDKDFSKKLEACFE